MKHISSRSMSYIIGSKTETVGPQSCFRRQLKKLSGTCPMQIHVSCPGCIFFGSINLFGISFLPSWAPGRLHLMHWKSPCIYPHTMIPSFKYKVINFVMKWKTNVSIVMGISLAIILVTVKHLNPSWNHLSRIVCNMKMHHFHYEHLDLVVMLGRAIQTLLVISRSQVGVLIF